MRRESEAWGRELSSGDGGGEGHATPCGRWRWQGWRPPAIRTVTRTEGAPFTGPGAASATLAHPVSRARSRQHRLVPSPGPGAVSATMASPALAGPWPPRQPWLVPSAGPGAASAALACLFPRARRREIAGPSETECGECAGCCARGGPRRAHVHFCASRSSRRAYDDCPGQAATGPIRDCLVPPRLPGGTRQVGAAGSAARRSCRRVQIVC